MNADPVWLEKEFVLWLHERTGGSQGVRDEALLESALFRPQNLYHYEETDILFLTLRRCVRPSFCFLAVPLWSLAKIFSHATTQRKSLGHD